MKLEGKVALITGSAQGIGRAIALRLAREGADIVVDDRADDSRAESTLAEVQALGRRGCVVSGDLGTVADDRRVVADAVAKMGRLDILVNNGGVEKNASFLEVTEQDYELVLNVNLRGAFFTSQAFAQHLQQTRRPGRIINISSVHEELPFPHFSPYCASKGGLKMLMRNLAIELAPLGITVNNVAPGAIATPINRPAWETPEALESLLKLIPYKRVGQAIDIGKAAVWLASDDSDYVNGQTLFVDGGMTLFPEFADGG